MATFVYFIFPITDARLFLPETAKEERLDFLPQLHNLKEGANFIRSFGPFQRRTKVEDLNFKTEDIYFKASQALGLSPIFKKIKFGRKKCPFFSPWINRRFFSDGKVVSRVELLFKLKKLNPNCTITPHDIKKALIHLMYMEVTIPKRSKNKISCKFFNAGSHLAKHYMRATTRITKKDVYNTKNWWVPAGMPMVFLELDKDVQFGDKLQGHKKREFNSLKEGINLSYIPFAKEGIPIAIWVLEKNSQYQGDKDYLKYLRINISRLHSEWECLKNISSLIRKEKIKIFLGDKLNKELNMYVFDSTELLLNQNLDNNPQSESEKILKKAIIFFKEKIVKEVSDYMSLRELFPKDVSDFNGRFLIENQEKKTIFISYSHNDTRFVKKLKRDLENQDIKVQIDIDELKFGDNIQEFIEESIRESDFTIFVVSKNSLRSAWVIIEALKTLTIGEVEQKKKLLPISIDDSLFSNDFYIESLKEINSKLERIWEQTEETRALGGGIENIDAERKRWETLKKHLPDVLAKIRETLVGDFRGKYKKSNNLLKLINLINEFASN
jgi:hypothetical protein